MTTPLREFLTIRRGEVLAEIRRLRAELDELRLAEAALNGTGQAKPEGTDEGRPTLKEAALEVLRERPDGARASEIVATINERYGTSFDRSSLSPQLSRLAGDGEVRLDARTWYLTNPRSAASAMSAEQAVRLAVGDANAPANASAAQAIGSKEVVDSGSRGTALAIREAPAFM